MLIEKYKSKYLRYADDDLSISDDDNKLILNEVDDNIEQGTFFEDDFSNLYDEYEDEIGLEDNSKEEFDSSIFKIGNKKENSNQELSDRFNFQIHSFDDLVRFTLETCERLKLECPQDLDRINSWVANCQQQHLKPTTVNFETPHSFKPSVGFKPLEVEMVSYDVNGNSKKIDTGAPDNISIDDVCTTSADDEF